jgi:hypothetical protein
MAPEVLLQSGHGRAADIWSVGCTVLQMVTGSPPWKEKKFSCAAQLMFHIVNTKEPPIIASYLSKHLQSFILDCFERDPVKRPVVAQLSQHEFLRTLAASTLAPKAAPQPSPELSPSSSNPTSRLKIGAQQQESVLSGGEIEATPDLTEQQPANQRAVLQPIALKGTGARLTRLSNQAAADPHAASSLQNDEDTEADTGELQSTSTFHFRPSDRPGSEQASTPIPASPLLQTRGYGNGTGASAQYLDSQVDESVLNEMSFSEATIHRTTAGSDEWDMPGDGDGGNKTGHKTEHRLEASTASTANMMDGEGDEATITVYLQEQANWYRSLQTAADFENTFRQGAQAETLRAMGAGDRLVQDEGFSEQQRQQTPAESTQRQQPYSSQRQRTPASSTKQPHQHQKQHHQHHQHQQHQSQSQQQQQQQQQYSYNSQQDQYDRQLSTQAGQHVSLAKPWGQPASQHATPEGGSAMFPNLAMEPTPVALISQSGVSTSQNYSSRPSSNALMNPWDQHEERPISTRHARNVMEQAQSREDEVQRKKREKELQWQRELEQELAYQRSLAMR